MELQIEELKKTILQTERLIIVTTEFFYMRTLVNRVYLKGDMDFEQVSKNRKMLNEKQFIGTFLIESDGEISYGIEPEHRRRGYATEALQACKDYYLKIGIEPYIKIRGENIESQGVASRCGFVCKKPYVKGLQTWKCKKRG